MGGNCCFFNISEAVIVELEIVPRLLPNARDPLGQGADVSLIKQTTVVFNPPQSPLLCGKVRAKREFSKSVRVCLEFLPHRLLNCLSDHDEKLLAKLIC